MGNSRPSQAEWLTIGVLVIVCVAMAVVINQNWRSTNRDQIYDNAVAAYQAVGEWQSDNDGIRPAYLNSRNRLGKTVFDYLPEGKRLVNPFTHRQTEPSDSTSSGCLRLALTEDGFEIIGYGQGGRELIRIPRDYKSGLLTMR